MNNTFFITGTDTGIGKTFVTCILMQFIKFHHKRVIGMKPIAAGVDIKKGEISNEDVNNPKPDPEGYIKAIQYLKLQLSI